MENGANGGPYPVDAPAAPGADGGFVLPMPLRQSPKNSSSKAKSESSTDGITIEEGSRLSQLLQEELIKMEDLENLNDEDNVLGQGSFGIVRKVRWRMTPAAAKVSHKGMPKQAKALCLRELELMVRCRHPNIVQFLGYVDTPFVIVMELLPGGDLERLVVVQARVALDPDHRLRGRACQHRDERGRRRWPARERCGKIQTKRSVG